ncbi:acetyl-CoA C-acetyltransferase [Halioxenophilus aromaticivorans]|uniref:Acetyl-CoA C-acetyltransferase n=1 Tax=Halioxenophilus aromaticivorans TaxID=1306992 RepID=A0AAV3U434_9ALTE
MAEAYIIDSVRTPRATGKPGKGAYYGMHPQHLAATVLKALRERNNLNTSDIDDVIWGTSSQKGQQAGDLARMAALDAGYDTSVSGVTMDRFCGSGLTAINLAAGQLKAGHEELIIAGGTEMMSHITEQSMKERELGILSGGLGTGNPRLHAKYPQSHQGMCADAIASMEGFTREQLDAFSLESQRRAAHAIANGYFDHSMVPVLDDDGNVVLDKDQHPRPETTMDDLAKLTPSFLKIADMPMNREGETPRGLINRVYPDVDIQCMHHAGSSSGVVDGAAAMLMASDAYVKKSGLKPRARVVTTANMGDDPTLMLNAPVPAAKKILARAGLTVADIDLWEVNEAFAVVVTKFIRDMGISPDVINVNGGAIALGHPIGATGAVLIGTVLDELERRNLKRGLITMCAAGGMAPAIIIERV